MKLQAHQIPEMSDLEKAMFASTLETMKSKRKAWREAPPRAHEKHQRIARRAERALKFRQQWGDDA